MKWPNFKEKKTENFLRLQKKYTEGSTTVRKSHKSKRGLLHDYISTLPTL